MERNVIVVKLFIGLIPLEKDVLLQVATIPNGIWIETLNEFDTSIFAVWHYNARQLPSKCWVLQEEKQNVHALAC